MKASAFLEMKFRLYLINHRYPQNFKRESSEYLNSLYSFFLSEQKALKKAYHFQIP